MTVAKFLPSVDMDDIAICMLTYNEERFIEVVLRSIKNSFPRFVLLDMGSTDNTLAIAKDTLGGVLEVVSWRRENLFSYGFAQARNDLTSAAKLPWAFHIDADELLFLPPGITKVALGHDGSVQEAQKVIRRNIIGFPDPVYDEARLNDSATSSVEHHVRLFKSSERVRWESYIHEEVWVDNTRASECASCTDLVLQHLSDFRQQGEKSGKEKLYAWMTMQAYHHEHLRSHLRPEYIAHARDNSGWLLPLAEEFGRQNNLQASW